MRVVLPGLAGQLVPDATPQIHDLLSVVIGAHGAAQLMPLSEVLTEHIEDGFKAGTHLLHVLRFSYP